jgi:hypothetical protein
MNSWLDSPVRNDNKINILVLDRKEANRRIWKNPNEFVQLLVARWSELTSKPLGNLVIYGSSFKYLTPKDQAILFRSADVIISPHGAQLANLIYASTSVSFIELSCLHTLDDENFWKLSYFGTFTKRLGMNAYHYETGMRQEIFTC